MASWDDILRATLKAAGKADDVIDDIVKKIAGQVDTPVVPAAKATGKKSAAEIAAMSKAERKLYNAAMAKESQAAATAAGNLRSAKDKLANVTEGEDIINATLGEQSKTKLGTEGIQQQFDSYFKQLEGGSDSAILKRSLNDPDYKALQAAEDKAVAKAEEEVFQAIESAKAAGKPMTEQEIRGLIASKAKSISDEVSSSAKTKAQTDIESMKARAQEGQRKLSDRELAAIARKEKASYGSAKERADEIAAQMKSSSAGGGKKIETRVKTLNELTPEEQRMSGVKAKLYKEKAVAQTKNQTAFIDKLEAMAKDKKLLPILDKEGKQVMEEIIVDGEKMTVPKFETRAEQSLRLEKQTPFKAKDVQEAGDGSPAKPAKTIDEKLNEAATKQSEVTESGAKLRAAQETSLLKGAEEAAAASDSPAAKDALKTIKQLYGRGNITKEEYLQRLTGVPKIYGKAVTPEEVAKLEKGSEAAMAAKKQRELESVAELEKKYGKGYTTKPGEGGTTQYVPAEVPKSELKGRKWVRDASGKLVLVKK